MLSALTLLGSVLYSALPAYRRQAQLDGPTFLWMTIQPTSEVSQLSQQPYPFKELRSGRFYFAACDTQC